MNSKANILTALFAFTFYISFFISSESLTSNISSTIQFVRYFATVLLAILCFYLWKKNPKFTIFQFFLGLWFIVCLAQYFISQSDTTLISKRVFQAFFFFSLLSCFIFRAYNPISQENLPRWFNPILVSIGLVISFTLDYAFEENNFYNGFGNSRGTFCLWLVQPITLTLIFFSQTKSKELVSECLILSPYIVVLASLGSRTAIAATFVFSCCFFSWKYSKKAAALVLSFNVLLTTMASSFLGKPHISIIRNSFSFSRPNMDSTLTLYDKIDIFTSYRLSSIEQAFYSFNIDNLLFGVGFGNALTYTPHYEDIGFFEIHNLILKHFFELGILGGILTLLILFFPLAFSISKNQSSVLEKVLIASLAVCVLIANIHPELLITSIGTSIVWVAVLAGVLGQQERR
jgi:hypothetical protein